MAYFFQEASGTKHLLSDPYQIRIFLSGLVAASPAREIFYDCGRGELDAKYSHLESALSVVLSIIALD